MEISSKLSNRAWEGFHVGLAIFDEILHRTISTGCKRQ
jgi:hypothetical protein